MKRKKGKMLISKAKLQLIAETFAGTLLELNFTISQLQSENENLRTQLNQFTR